VGGNAVDEWLLVGRFSGSEAMAVDSPRGRAHVDQRRFGGSRGRLGCLRRRPVRVGKTRLVQEAVSGLDRRAVVWLAGTAAAQGIPLAPLLAVFPTSPPRRPDLLGVSTPADRVGRRFTAERPNQLWFTDITELPVRDGKVYCCAILDAFSKMVVARTFSTVADTALVNNAVNMAVRERVRLEGAILHVDDGTQFTSWAFSENLRRHGLLESFGTVGDCFDNAVIESFWGRLQTELLDIRKWSTTLELTIAMADTSTISTTSNAATPAWAT
jgi:transposase InsO family protein